MIRSPLRSPFVDLLRPSIGVPVLTLVQKAIGILRKYGTNAHIYIPGIGTLNGIAAGNYLDSAGTTAATVDNPVGLVVDSLGAVNTSQATSSNKPILRQSGGKYYLEFDGSNDSLSLSAPLFQQADDHCVGVAFKCTTAAGFNAVFEQRNYTLSAPMAPALEFYNGTLYAFYRDDASTTITLNASIAVSELAVASVRKVGTTYTLNKNGVVASTQTGALGTTTLNEIKFGANAWNTYTGNIAASYAIKGSVSAAERLVLDRFLGLFSGVSF